MQGPPGTGKTTVMKHIVKNWFLNSQNKSENILVSAQSNIASEVCAQFLYEDPILRNYVTLVQSEARENWFDIDLDNLHPYSLVYKIIQDLSFITKC
jgi:Cdc6-like AAA superfamily ATPase